MKTIPLLADGPAVHAPERVTVVVAVDLPTSAIVLDEAADLAAELNADLTVVHVDPTRGVVGTRRDGTPLVLPIDPDLPDDIHQPVLDAIQARVAAQLRARPLTWTLRTTVGNPAKGISRIAEEVGARIIVVGTHGNGLSHALHRLVESSVSSQLVRHQTRPVLVVPDAPVTGTTSDDVPRKS